MRTVRVQRYRKRHPTRPSPRTASEQKRVVQGAMRKLSKLHADSELRHACYVQVSDTDSQVMPPKGGFKKNHCTVINLERGDVADEVEATTSLYHESLHAADIFKDGEGGVSKDNEIIAHKLTMEFLRDWKAQEPAKAERINEELEEERESIEYLRTHDE